MRVDAPSLKARGAKRKTGQRGFTLIELMVVLVILAMLAGLVAPRIFDQLDVANADAARTQVRMLRSALESYRLEVGEFPSVSDGLTALIAPPERNSHRWQGPYLADEIPMDPWGRPYVYGGPANTLQGFVLYSLGADGAEGGDDNDADIGYMLTSDNQRQASS